jgi:hypothetical protein
MCGHASLRGDGQVDPLVASQLTAVLSRLLDGALGEAGKQAWEALVRLVRRAPRSDRQVVSSPGNALLDLQERPGDPVRAEALGAALARLAAADPGFAALLQEWWASADHLVRQADAGSVNTIRGDVRGPAVQARDIHGPISFGEGRPAS